MKSRTLASVGIGLLMVLGGAAARAEEKPLVKARIGYGGGACEGFFYAAQEYGYWKEEGLDVELVKCADAVVLRDSLAFGKIDAADGMLFQWIKPLENGLDAKLVAGLHTGCIQTLVPVNSPIKTVADLKGKKVGVPEIGGAPMIVTSRALHYKGFDPKKDVDWRVFPGPDLPLILSKGEVDAIAMADPLAQVEVDAGRARSLVNTASDPEFKEDYCCFLIVNGKVIRDNPTLATKIARGTLRAAVYVSQHPEDAARIAVERKYVSGGTVAQNARCIASYNYRPAVESAVSNIAAASVQLKEIGVLTGKSDADQLARKSFLALPDAGDAYIKTLVEAAAKEKKADATGAKPLAKLTAEDLAAVGESCCDK